MSSLAQNALPHVQTSAAVAEAHELWYALQTRARHEKRIGAELEKKGMAAFVPTVSQAHRWSDRTKIVEVPLFSCYVFVKLSLSAAQRLEVLRTMGVFRFVCVNSEPAPIPEDQIESLQKMLKFHLPMSVHGFLKLGQRVRICGGALDGVQGIFTAVRGENKLVISVDLIQQSVAVTIDGYAVEPIS